MPEVNLKTVLPILLCGLGPAMVHGAAPATEAAPAVTRIAVVEGANPTNTDIAGTYEKATLDVNSGIIKGTGAGSPSVELGGISVGTSVPILMLPGAIAGGIYGKAQKELQDFRDALADDLADATHQPLTNYLLALHVYQNLRNLPGLEVRLYGAGVAIPEDIDEVLYVSIRDMAIDVEKNDANLKTTAEVELSRRDGSKAPDRRWFYYQDSDTLGNWTRNDNALWRDYANFARHYLGREIATDVFSGVKLRYSLQPQASASVKTGRNDTWHGSSKSKTPELAWEFTLPAQDPQFAWADALGDADIDFDVEIYDKHRLVYAKERVPDATHRVEAALEPCGTYLWSVRPVYHVDGGIRYGEWMRHDTVAENLGDRGLVGRDASAAPAYVQDFASLSIDCRAR